MGRFINADAFASTGVGLLGNNMFTYCNNNSINLVDRMGTLPFGVRPMQVAICDGGQGDGSGIGPSAHKDGPHIPDKYDDSYYSDVENFINGFEETTHSLLEFFEEQKNNILRIKGGAQIISGLAKISNALTMLAVSIPGPVEDLQAAWDIGSGFLSVIKGIGSLFDSSEELS